MKDPYFRKEIIEISREIQIKPIPITYQMLDRLMINTAGITATRYIGTKIWQIGEKKYIITNRLPKEAIEYWKSKGVKTS